MKIKITANVPVDSKHSIEVGSEHEVLRRNEDQSRHWRGWWIQGDGEEVLIFRREAEEIEDE